MEYNTRNPEHWTKDDVGQWLDNNGLQQYREKFEGINIDGSLLFQITDEDLQTDLGVGVRLHRVKIIEAIKKLQEEPVPAEPEIFQDISQPTELEYEEEEDENESYEILSQQVHHINIDTEAQVSNMTITESRCEILILKVLEGQLINNIFITGIAGATIGRHSASNDIVISESFVSRRHCDIKYNESTNQFLLYDVGSTTGTFIMIRQPIHLKPDVMFQMGLSEFKVTNLKYNPMGQAIEMELLIFEGPARQQNIRVTADGLTIGRDTENSCSIREDSQMSSFHAKIYLEAGHFMLIDVGSTNRTWIRLSAEGEKSQPWSLVVGDLCKIGSTVFLVQNPDLSSFPLPQPKQSVNEDVACKICYQREYNAAFYPCGHMTCFFCADKMQNCPICRRKIQEIVKLYK